MPSCEKCWRDACGEPRDYANLVHLRSRNGDVCTPEEQAGGQDATVCPFCGRRTVHVYSEVCMVEGCVGQSKHDTCEGAEDANRNTGSKATP